MSTSSTERADLLAALAMQRHFLRFTVRDLTDEQAGQRPTASELCLGGLIKHVTDVESAWADFIIHGPTGRAGGGEDGGGAERAATFRMQPGETLAGVLGDYERVAARTDGLVADIADLDGSQPLPDAPWFEKGARWSARRVLLHILAETAHHAGHADIIRESLDGARTMG